MATERMDIIRTAFLRPDPSLRLYDQKFEFIFLLDNSGSMQGLPIQLAKQAMRTILKGLPTTCRFNIITFNSSYRSLFPQSDLYTESTVEIALAWVNEIHAGGGTNVHAPLEYVYRQSQFSGFLTQIFFLTDGGVEQKETVLAMVAAKTAHSRTFSLGIGDSVDRDFIIRIAQNAGGLHSFIANNTPMYSTINEFVKTAVKPAILKPIRVGHPRLLFGYE